MAEDEKEHKKKLKEAQKAYSRYFKAFKQGRITREELKEKLRPFKYELKELGYPVKIKDDDRPAPEEIKVESAVKEAPPAVHIKPWTKRSSLTVEEIERRVDMISPGGSGSELLRRKYEERYGEKLIAPEDLLPFERMTEDLPSRSTSGSLSSDDRQENREETNKEGKGSFLKSLFKGGKERNK